MIPSAKGAVWYGVALFCLVTALWCGYRALDIAATVGDAKFEPPSVCDGACQADWDRYGRRADYWLAGAGALAIATVMFGLYGRKSRCLGNLSKE